MSPHRTLLLLLSLTAVWSPALGSKPKGLSDSHPRVRLTHRPAGQEHKGRELHYFALQGLGEPIRMMLEYVGVAYDSVMYFNTKEYKAIAPFGQMPLYKDETLESYLAQSGTILRHLARETGMAGNSVHEMARVDMISECAKDILQKRSNVKEFNPSNKEPLTKDAEKLQMFLEKAAALNPESKKYFVGEKATLADIMMLHALDSVQQVAKINDFDLLKALDFSGLSAFVTTWKAEPTLAVYYESDRRVPMTEKEAGMNDKYTYLSELPDSYAEHKEEL
eukprot:CAMPEP_0184291302 /NCGR_PEP_ID=MMETSP1049-20130417/3365_1 /TAXON_ID=77928 /ORGANISM="Proteomonas sulcata, Strain CCMP704" /LENGTH=278 /DNA_ID=CAMNT_0026598719 /DNA_START=93 /DNA_END=929 /DNA_ORIENTATION=+